MSTYAIYIGVTFFFLLLLLCMLACEDVPSDVHRRDQERP